jgi:hypothetical protein
MAKTPQQSKADATPSEDVLNKPAPTPVTTEELLHGAIVETF